MKTLVLAAGRGRNLYPITETRPKPMIKIRNKPILQYLIDTLIDSNLTDIEIVIGHKSKSILDYFQTDSRYQMYEFNYLYQKEQSGIGDAVLLAKDKFQDRDYFLLIYGDIFVNSNIIQTTINSFKGHQKPTAAVCLTQSPHLFGNIYMNQNMQITRIVEKPQQNLGNYVLAGVFVLPGSFFSILENTCGKIDAAFGQLIAQTGLYASIWEEDWIDVGYPWDILTANQIAMSNWSESRISSSVKIEGNVTINGPVWIEDNVHIESGAVIKGPCYIGPDCYIGNNVLVRQNSSIGAGSVIGFGVEIKNSVLFGKNRIGRLSFVGDSVIGEEAIIGSGVMTVNTKLDRTPVLVELNGKIIASHLTKLGAFVGDYAEIEANNTFKAGTVIPAEARIPGHFTNDTER